MAEPLKEVYNRKFMEDLVHELVAEDKNFNAEGFYRQVFIPAWEHMALKERMRHISLSLREFLPEKYTKSLEILMPVSENFSGFQYMLFPDYVEVFGLDDYKASIEALEHFTRYSSSEYAVRPFILRYHKPMMAQMKEWAKSDNHHVRRLASEGCRPRLPWSIALPLFKNDPSEILPILRILNNDESEYVRKSVANNLNDISKDNPQIVIDIAKKWHGKHRHRNWIVKHGCRTLLKQGCMDVMGLFGFSPPDHINIMKFKVQKAVDTGGDLKFSFVLQSSKTNLGKLKIDYFIDFVRKNGKMTRKVFNLSESETDDNNKYIEKKHSFKKITTRQYYPGTHKVGVIVNGREMASDYFELV